MKFLCFEDFPLYGIYSAITNKSDVIQVSSVIIITTWRPGFIPNVVTQVLDLVPRTHWRRSRLGTYARSANLSRSDSSAFYFKSGRQLVPIASYNQRPSIYYPDFIAANQESPAGNVVPRSKTSWDHVEKNNGF
jgi:hypothetical protein